MTPKLIASILTIAGAAVAVAGVALVYVPAAMILAGGALAAFGLGGLSWGEKK